MNFLGTEFGESKIEVHKRKKLFGNVLIHRHFLRFLAFLNKIPLPMNHEIVFLNNLHEFILRKKVIEREREKKIKNI